MLDELDDEQRARLCILEQVIRISESSLDAFDMVRMARWVEIGCDPDASAAGHTRSLDVGQFTTGGRFATQLEPAGEPTEWVPAVR